MTAALFVGLMSGTSLDGVDAVVADLSSRTPRVLGRAHQAFDEGLRSELLGLNSAGANEIERSALAGNALAGRYAVAVREAIASSGCAAEDIRAIGCHGQTIRHRPERGYTVQIGNAALLAELTGLSVVADFRSRDVAAGGQGAPLAPAFHAAVFASAEEDRAVLNLGGIANVTRLARGAPVLGFDSGPGNCLLDLWAAEHLGRPYDEGGAWAAGGTSLPAVLERMLAEPYFAAPPPKSTGRDLFNAAWLRGMLEGGEAPRDVQATLLELTARSAGAALTAHCAEVARTIVCGGGVCNPALMQQLARCCRSPLEPSGRHGIEPQLVEAVAFAWLAQQALEGTRASLPSVTGARGARVLGTIYPP